MPLLALRDAPFKLVKILRNTIYEYTRFCTPESDGGSKEKNYSSIKIKGGNEDILMSEPRAWRAKNRKGGENRKLFLPLKHSECRGSEFGRIKFSLRLAFAKAPPASISVLPSNVIGGGKLETLDVISLERNVFGRIDYGGTYLVRNTTA